MKLFSCVSFITLQILGFFHEVVLILIFYGLAVKTKNRIIMNWHQNYMSLQIYPNIININSKTELLALFARQRN